MQFKQVVEQAVLRVEPSVFTKTQITDFIVKRSGIKWSLTLERKVSYWLRKMCIVVSKGSNGISTKYQLSVKWLEQYF